MAHTDSGVHLVLASQSQYKQKQLHTLGLPFSTFNPNIDESAKPAEHAKALAQRLATQKAQAWQPSCGVEEVTAGILLETKPEATQKTTTKTYQANNKHSAYAIIGSDQTALCGTTLLGKPHTTQNAIKQLELCSSNTVTFYSAIALLETHTNTLQEYVATTQVTFKTLSRAQIEHYIERDQPLDCAGSFKSEGLGIALFTAIKSDDPTALVGLPLIGVCNLLHNLASKHTVYQPLAPLGI